MIRRLVAFLVFSVCLLSANPSFSFALRPVAPPAPVASYLRGEVFVNLSVREFESAAGTRLGWLQRMYFHAVQHRVKRALRSDPTLLITPYYDTAAKKFKFNALWFVIGAVIGPLGVLLAYVSHPQKNGPNKKDRTSSAWLGFAFWILWFGYIFIF